MTQLNLSQLKKQQQEKNHETGEKSEVTQTGNTGSSDSQTCANSEPPAPDNSSGEEVGTNAGGSGVRSDSDSDQPDSDDQKIELDSRADVGDPALSSADIRDSGAPVKSNAGGLLRGLKLGGIGKAAAPSAHPESTSDTEAGSVEVTPSGPVDSLEALASDESTGLPSTESGYVDEIPATAPERELPEDMTPEMERFVKSLDGIYTVMSDPELFGQMIRTIMMELQENPQYEKIIADDDVAVMIRGMRESMGLARIRKQEKSRKAPSRAKKDTGPNEMLDDLQALAADMGVSFD